MAIAFTLNGNSVSVDVDPETPLLEVLRNDFELNGPKFGCGLAQCGACFVIIDGGSQSSCLLPIRRVAGKHVVTLEGLGNPQEPHPLQSAFIEEQALQCGYCTSGIIVTAAALLERNPTPTNDEIRQALDGHLCRCGAQPRMIRAVAKAAERMVEDSQ